MIDLSLAENTRAMCEMTGLGLCFDWAHAALACLPAGQSVSKFAEIVAPHIRHLHLSDGAGICGEGLQIGDGQIDFLEAWPLFVKINAICVPEIWIGHHNVGAGFQTALERLAEIAWASRVLAGVRPDQTRSELAELVVPNDATLATTLRAFERNTFGTVFVVDPNTTVVGVATDGEIRRGLLAGQTLQTCVSEVMTSNFTFALDDVTAVDIEARLSSRIPMLPILNPGRQLVSFATIKQPVREGVLTLDPYRLECLTHPNGMVPTDVYSLYSRRRLTCTLLAESLE